MKVKPVPFKRRFLKRAYPEEPKMKEEEAENNLLKNDSDSKAAKATRAANTKLTGYRRLAVDAGFTTGRRATPVMSSGVDVYKEILLVRDVKKMLKFFPQNIDDLSYEAFELEERYDVSNESYPGSALREAQARTTNLLRHIINESVLRSMEMGKMRIDAATVNSVVRSFARNMRFTAATPPRGVLVPFCVAGERIHDYNEANETEHEKAAIKKIQASVQAVEDLKNEKKAANDEKKAAKAAKAAKAD